MWSLGTWPVNMHNLAVCIYNIIRTCIVKQNSLLFSYSLMRFIAGKRKSTQKIKIILGYYSVRLLYDIIITCTRRSILSTGRYSGRRAGLRHRVRLILDRGYFCQHGLLADRSAFSVRVRPGHNHHTPPPRAAQWCRSPRRGRATFSKNVATGLYDIFYNLIGTHCTEMCFSRTVFNQHCAYGNRKVKWRMIQKRHIYKWI